MEKDIVLGPETSASLVFAAGKVTLGVAYAGKQASAGLNVSLDIDQFAAMLKQAIPGTVDDAIIDVLVAAMKVIP